MCRAAPLTKILERFCLSSIPLYQTYFRSAFLVEKQDTEPTLSSPRFPLSRVLRIFLRVYAQFPLFTVRDAVLFAHMHSPYVPSFVTKLSAQSCGIYAIM